MPSAHPEPSPLPGRTFTDTVGQLFTVLTIVWDKILISYANGKTAVVDYKDWGQFVTHRQA